MSFRKPFFVFFFIFILDYISKKFIDLSFSPGWVGPFPFGGIAVFKDFIGIDFCLHYVANRGAAWGIGGEWQTLLVCLRIILMGILLGYLKIGSKRTRYQYPLVFILAGGVGNIVDYFTYGHVVDMFHFIFWGYSYPVFNVADVAIFSGVVRLLFLTQRTVTSNVTS